MWSCSSVIKDTIRSIREWEPEKEFKRNVCPKDAVDFEILDGYYTIIRGCAFIDCVSLKTIKLPKSIIIINYGAFWNCSSLQTIDLPPSLTTLGSYVFKNCSSLKKIDLPPSLMTMGSYVFLNCTSLRKIDLPSSLTTLGSYVFKNCSSLKKIDLPPSLMTMGDGAFHKCRSLREIFIQGPIPLIPMFTFVNCRRLKRVVLPETILSIEEKAFSNCASLLRIRIPNSVESIHASAFQGCLHLQFENCNVTDSIVENSGVHPCDTPKQNPWHEDKYKTYRCSSIKLKHGPGAMNGFGGVTQKGYGLEMCGISLEQMGLGEVICKIVRNDLKTYDQYLQSEILDDDEDENFKAWLMYIQDNLILTK